jgi:hypothetical protein
MNEHSADALIASGHLSPDWRSSFLAVPREAFIPDTIWRPDTTKTGPDLVPVHRDEHPEQWRELVDSDDAVITQVDDGHPVGGDVGDLITARRACPKWSP